MSKYAVIFWSGTGNTEAMAKAIVEGIEAGGASADLLDCGSASQANLSEYEGFAFGCSSSGAEELEQGEFRPMWDSAVSALKGKKIVLFGSYGWGGGAYIEDWKNECSDMKVVDSYACLNTPEEEQLESCKKLGQALLG